MAVTTNDSRSRGSGLGSVTYVDIDEDYFDNTLWPLCRRLPECYAAEVAVGRTYPPA